MQIRGKKDINGNSKNKDYLQKVGGSIANVLNQHIKELEPLMNSPAQLPLLKEKVNKLLLSDEVGQSFGGDKAAKILGNITNYGHYLSTLASYMTGVTIGR